jgi:hypothetical protein
VHRLFILVEQIRSKGNAMAATFSPGWVSKLAFLLRLVGGSQISAAHAQLEVKEVARCLPGASRPCPAAYLAGLCADEGTMEEWLAESIAHR